MTSFEGLCCLVGDPTVLPQTVAAQGPEVHLVKDQGPHTAVHTRVHVSGSVAV